MPTADRFVVATLRAVGPFGDPENRMYLIRLSEAESSGPSVRELAEDFNATILGVQSIEDVCGGEDVFELTQV